MKAISMRFLAILFFSIICMLPAYIFDWPGQDARIHGQWTKNFVEILSEGNLYPRFAYNMFFGFGSFVFYFYPPVSFYFNSIFSFLGNDTNYYFTAISASANLSLFFSGISAFFWLRNKADDNAALLCALFYMVLPIHLLVDFYIAGAIAQFWCYVWFPLILLSSEMIGARQKYGIPILAVSLALLVMTNVPTAIVFAPFATIYALVISERREWPRFLVAGWFALGLASIYILPVLAYRHLVNIDLHWVDGYGFNYYDYFLEKNLFEPDQSFRVVILVSAVITTVYGLVFISKSQGKLKKLILSFMATAFFMCFSVSNFAWIVFPLLEKIQFPRRFLVVSTVFILLAAIFSLKVDSRNAMKRIGMLIITLVIVNFVIVFRSTSIVNSERNKILRNYYDNNVEAFPSYLPSTNVIPFFYSSIDKVSNCQQIQTSGIGNIKVGKWKSRDIEFEVNGLKGDVIKIRQFYFPFWTASILGRKIDLSEDDELKIIKIILPEDLKNTTIQLKLELSPAEKIGMILSSITLLIIILIVIVEKIWIKKNINTRI